MLLRLFTHIKLVYYTVENLTHPCSWIQAFIQLVKYIISRSKIPKTKNLSDTNEGLSNSGLESLSVMDLNRRFRGLGYPNLTTLHSFSCHLRTRCIKHHYIQNLQSIHLITLYPLCLYLRQLEEIKGLSYGSLNTEFLPLGLGPTEWFHFTKTVRHY